ncbi:hypothetical protein [uncultured Paludibaculum sp.]|uniref:hypothetical protein n=1 Tax=uncultured Paludibaculum sp. TaxID=1765020 RepID=UPI002AAC21B6|nr:hypothetical protein [uncultured Paludibaculum sp.]
MTLASELVGLQSAAKVIQERIDYIQATLAGGQRKRATTPQPTSDAPAPAKRTRKRSRPSKAKLEALATARAALAARRSQAAAPKGGRKRATNGD